MTTYRPLIAIRATRVAAFCLMVAMLAVPFAAHGFDLPEAPSGPPPAFVPGELIVKYEGEEVPQIVEVADGTEKRAAAELAQQSAVEYAEPNYIARALAQPLPNDPLYAEQWNLRGAPGSINVEPVWQKTTGFSAVVAIVDSGVAYENYTDRVTGVTYMRAPDLAGVTFSRGWDFVNDDAHANDDYGHGTHIAGTIAQRTGNGIGAAGIAPRARIIPVKVLDHTGYGTYADIADGIRYAADRGAKVINVSLGGSEPSQYLEEAVAYAHTKGSLVVAATGNNGSGRALYPAAYDSYVLAVGATDYDAKITSYSNRGSSVDLVAPGGDLSADRNKDGKPDGIVQETFQGAATSFAPYRFQGTSMAAAHVSGVAALLMSSRTAKTAGEVRNKLIASATDLGPVGRDDTYGYGLVNAERAVFGMSQSTSGTDKPTVGGSEPKPPAAEPNTQSGAVLIASDFTGGMGGWTAGRGYSVQTASVMVGTDGGYVAARGAVRDSTLMSSMAALRSSQQARAVFSWSISPELDAGEYIAFDFSRDGGRTWSELRRLEAGRDAQGLWRAEEVTIPAGGTALVVRFRASLSTFTEYAYVDSVRVTVK